MNDGKSLEAAARAIAQDGFGADWPHSMRTAQAAITAYLSAEREAGRVMVHLGELERASVVLTPRPNGEG